jgi:dipeptidyl aminopeptidase/acylaminoacyl peptidase
MRRSATAGSRGRTPRDPYGLGQATGYIGPALALVALVVIAIVTVGLMNGQLPFRTGGGPGTQPGPTVTEAPSNVVITPPETTFPGSIVYAKAGNIWIQTGKEVRQLTNGGEDSMPAFSTDGTWVYFIRVQEGRGKFPAGGHLARAWYDLSTPLLMRTRPDGSGSPQRLLTGQYRTGSSTWFYWLRQPTPSPDGHSIAVISDGPNPLQSDIVLQIYDVAAKTLTSLHLAESLSLGHQDPAWRPDGKLLLYVKNGRELTRGAPQIYRYDPKTKANKPVTGPGYLSPSWSPDGRFIAATKTNAFGSDVVILDAAGKELLKVSDDDHSFSPAWSPAGDAIAFLHLQGTIVDLRMAQLDSSTGRWTVAKTVDLTKVSGLDGASRPSWFVPASELLAPSPAPSAASSGGASPSGSAAP